MATTNYGLGPGQSSTDATFNPYTAKYTGASGPADPSIVQANMEKLGSMGLGLGSTGIVASQSNPAPTPAPTLSPTSVNAGTTATIGTPTKWDVTPDQTVQGRIASIIDPNSPLMQQAKTQADEQSNARGLINSSMAVTGGQDAMYRAATPIAAADAATYAKAAGYNADEANQVAAQNATMKNAMTQANLSANTSMFNTTANNASNERVAVNTTESQGRIATMNADSNQRIAALDAANRVQVQQLQNQFQQLTSTSQQASQAFNQYVVASANIQNNPNMDAATKNAALQQLWQTTQSQLVVLSHLNGLDLTSQLDMTPYTQTPVPTPAPTAAPATPTNAGGGA